ncbi:hypothetical protein SIID45300_00219 [Candidatus Magnetaquicoccaceae bacterium FCR-1]|uniref:DUF1574 domain-containing protein n=2 Tax=Candidatus Magnetaquiglobus chichijimensis TaxID=3141448 RepID=A0ABQ0C4W5_9PROT
MFSWLKARSPEARQTRPGVRDRWGGWLSVALILAVILVPPALIRTQRDPIRFDDHHLRQLQALQPEYVFVGSSTLLSRIDPEWIGALRPGTRAYLLGELGSMSALWYLWVKNSLLPSGVRPKALFIHFRDTELTDPIDETGSVTGQEKIARNRVGDEALFDRVMGHHKGWIGRLREGLLGLYPIQETWRQSGLWLIDGIGFFAASPEYRAYLHKRLFGSEPVTSSEAAAMVAQREHFKRQLAEGIFSTANQRVLKGKSGVSGGEEERLLFSARLEHSFLPELIRLGKEVASRVVLVRIESRPAMDETRHGESGPLRAYMADLREHLTREGVELHDFNDERAFRFEMYLDGGHIKPEFRRFYTERFVERLAEVFR